MKLALRTRILLGAAVAITAYVAFSPADSPPVEAAGSDEIAPRARSPRQAEPHGERTLRALLLLAHRVSGDASAGALFPSHSWNTPPPPPPPAPPTPTMTASQLAALNAPTAPPLPFAYMGSYKPDGAAPVFFLIQADRVYDVRIGDTLDNAYTVDSFTNGQLVMTYKPLNIQQQLSAGGSQ